MPDDENKVTLAVLRNDLVHYGDRIESLCADVAAWRQDQESRIRALESWQRTTEERWRRQEEERKADRVKSWVGDGATALLAAIAAYLGVKL